MSHQKLTQENDAPTRQDGSLLIVDVRAVMPRVKSRPFFFNGQS